MAIKKSIIFSVIGGFVLGKAGEAVFGSDAAKKVYTTITEGAMITKDAVMESVEKIQAGASDIAADARLKADEYQAKKDARFLARVNNADEEEADLA